MTKEQLFEIAVDQGRPLSERYNAARELQQRTLTPEKFSELVRLYPRFTVAEIAERLEVPHQIVNNVAIKYGLSKACG